MATPRLQGTCPGPFVWVGSLVVAHAEFSTRATTRRLRAGRAHPRKASVAERYTRRWLVKNEAFLAIAPFITAIHPARSPW